MFGNIKVYGYNYGCIVAWNAVPVNIKLKFHQCRFYDNLLETENFCVRYNDDRNSCRACIGQRPLASDSADRFVPLVLQHHRHHPLLPDPLHEVAHSDVQSPGKDGGKVQVDHLNFLVSPTSSLNSECKLPSLNNIAMFFATWFILNFYIVNVFWSSVYIHSPDKEIMSLKINVQFFTNFFFDFYVMYIFRWFAPFYMVMMFFVIPLYIFGLSMAGPVALYIGVLPFITMFIVAIIINVLQKKIPQHLPDILRNWSFLPEWMRSLDPIDRYWFCFSSRKQQKWKILFSKIFLADQYFDHWRHLTSNLNQLWENSDFSLY